MTDWIECSTQEELDAVKPGDIAIVRRGHFTARENSTVTAWGNSTVTAWENSTVTAWENSTVTARENSTVTARGNSTVTARGNSTVTARENSTVTARGNSTVTARENSTVTAWENSTVTAAGYVAVHLMSKYSKVKGGVLITPPDTETCDAATWLDFYGIEVVDGKVILFKAVGSDWQTERGPRWTYEPGTEVVAEDFQPARYCGHGLHLCAAPEISARYYQDDNGRYVAVEVDAATLIPLGDKVKVPACAVLHEVDRHGKKLETSAVMG